MGTHRLDISGLRSGKLTAVKKVGYGIDKDGKRYALWLCKCDCGGEKIAKQHTLVTNKIKSCGCLRKREYGKSIQHGKSRTRLYHIHNGIKERCLNPNDQHYKDYGGRGIKVCNEWIGKEGFINFFVWSIENGYKENLTIDRIDVNGNYEPSNCRWTTQLEQARNTRNNVRYNINGEMLLIKEISEKYGIPESTLRGRTKRGLTMKQAINHKYRTKCVKGE